MTQSKKSTVLRSIDPSHLGRVRGGMLYPAVKLTDGTMGVLASDIYIKFDGIAGEAGGEDK